MAAGRFIRAVYSRVAGSRALRRPLGAVRSNPRVRAFARRHVEVLLAPGTTWANVDGALRLLSEDSQQQIVFGPWRGDATTELLYWAPFVGWAQEHFGFTPAADRSGAAVFPSEPVVALVEQYRSGAAPPRPLLKRARYERLARPKAPGGVPDRYIAVGVGSPVRIADPVVAIDAAQSPETQHAVIAGATGLVAPWSHLVLLGVLSGIPTVAVRSAGDGALEPDLDLAARIAGELGVPLTVLDDVQLETLASALGGTSG
jgi:hypothetical protein